MTQGILTFKASAVFVDLSCLYPNIYSSNSSEAYEWKKRLKELVKDNKNSEYERKRLKLNEYARDVEITIYNNKIISVSGGFRHELIRFTAYPHRSPADYRGNSKDFLNNKTITK